MAYNRAKRPRRAPRRYGWDDDDFEFVMDSDSEQSTYDSDQEDQSTGDSEGDSDQDSSSTDSDSGDDNQDAVDVAAGWTAVDTPPVLPPFTGQPGVNLPADHGTEASDYFSLFLDDNFFNSLSVETNRYAQQVIGHMEMREHSRMRKWQPTTPGDMKVFVAILFAMGLDARPSHFCYWSEDPIFSNSFYTSLMSRDRFLLILKCFHLTDNDARHAAGDAQQDKLWKIRPLVALLNERFPLRYSPKKDLSVDETMVPWTGRLAFKQYIPIKPDKYGIKLYQLCESSSGYTLRFKVYCGRDGEQAERNTTANVVKDLLTERLELGHVVWMDNFYSGIPLFEDLRARGTLAAGTLRLGRVGIPQAVKTKDLRKGEVIFRRRGDLLALKWRDKKVVTFLSTGHTAGMGDSRTARDAEGHPLQVPMLKLEYDLHMNGVDKNDQNVGYYAARRKSTKWYKKLCFYFFDLVRFQSYIIYSKDTANPMSQLNFLQELVHSLIETSGVITPPFGRPRLGNPLQRLTARHFPSLIPPTDTRPNPCKRCQVCCIPSGHRRERGVPAPRRKETRYQCAPCGVALCAVPCFELYHTHTNFKQAYENAQN